MESLHLSDFRPVKATLLPDSFIEEAMPKANGDFVKIYIYLLSTDHHPERELSLSSIADAFACTEKDVIRALTYWAKEGYLTLETNGEHLTGLAFTDPETTIPDKTPAKAEPAAGTIPNAETETTVKTETAAKNKTAAETASASAEHGPGSPSAEGDPINVSLSAERIRSLKEDNAEAQQLLYVAETYLNRPLSRSDITCILYFYDTLHMSADLVEYLIEYCVLHQKTSIHYIQKVGLEWHRAGYTSAKEAKEGSSSIRKEYFSVLNALGISNRKPIPAEEEYIDRWMKVYGFDLPIILEACKRTVTKTGGSSFAYAEGILSNWNKQNLHSMKDIQKEDERYQASRRKKEPAEKNASKAGAPNRFHNFQQRNYNYEQLEKDLLKNQW